MIILSYLIEINSYPRYEEPISLPVKRTTPSAHQDVLSLDISQHSWTGSVRKLMHSFIYGRTRNDLQKGRTSCSSSKRRTTSEARIHRHGLVVPAHMEIHPSPMKKGMIDGGKSGLSLLELEV